MKSKFEQILVVYSLLHEQDCIKQRMSGSDVGPHEMSLLEEEFESVKHRIISKKMDLLEQVSFSLNSYQWRNFCGTVSGLDDFWWS